MSDTICRNTLTSEDRLITLAEDRNDSLTKGLIGIIRRMDRAFTVLETKADDLKTSNSGYETRFKAIQKAINSLEFGGG